MQHTLNTVLATADETLRLPQSAVNVMELSQSEETKLSQLLEAIQVDPTFVESEFRLDDKLYKIEIIVRIFPALTPPISL